MKTSRVSTVKGLRRAMADDSVDRIVVKQGSYVMDEPIIVRSRPLIIEGNDSTFSRPPAPDPT